MGAHNTREELTYEELKKIEDQTQIPVYEINQWYCRFYDFSKGKDLDQEHFKKYFKELLPSFTGNSDEFLNLAFKGIFTNIFETYL